MRQRPHLFPVHFDHGMTEYADYWSATGYAIDEIAAGLARTFDERITVTHVQQWCRRYRHFRNAVEGAEMNFLADCFRTVSKAARDGDVATARWGLERRSNVFKPSQRVEHSGRIDSLQGVLDRRQGITEEELEADGILSYDED